MNRLSRFFSIVFVVVPFSLGVSIWLNGMGSVNAESNQLDLGTVQLTGRQWGNDTGSALQIRSQTQGRSEIQLIPNGTDSDGAGGEVTIFNTDAIADPANSEMMVMRGQPNLGYVFQVQASGTGRLRPILMDAMSGWPTFAVNNDGTVGIRRGISNTEYGGGFSHGRFASCSGMSCQTHISWQIDFADTNYTLTCSMEGATGAVSVLEKYTYGAVLGVQHFTTSATEKVDCIAVHD